MKKLVGFIAFLVGTLFLTACSSSSPSDVTKKAYGYIQDEDYESYVDLLYVKPGENAEQVKKEKKDLILLLKGLSEQKTAETNKIKSYKVISEEIDENGEEAVVKMNVVYENGKEEEETTRLKKDEDGNWKIQFAK